MTRIITVMLVTVLFMEAQMPTVFEVLLHAARNLDGLIEGVATGAGSTTTLVDSHLGAAYAGREDDEFNGGSLFLKTDASNAISGEAVGTMVAPDFAGTLAIKPIVAGSLTIVVNGSATWLDNGDGTLNGPINDNGKINYTTGAVTLFTEGSTAGAVVASYQYVSTLFLPVIAVVTDFTASTGTVTHEATGTGRKSASGDTYGLMSRRYPRWLLFQKLNECVQEIADYVSVSTTLVSAIANDQVSVASTARVLRVLAGNADTTDRAWRMVTRYTRHGEVIRLMDGAPADADTIAVETLGTPAQVTSESALLSDWYSAEWLGLETAARCMRWRLQQPGADAQLVTTLLNDLLRRVQNSKGRLSAWRSVSVKWPEYPEN